MPMNESDSSLRVCCPVCKVLPEMKPEIGSEFKCHSCGNSFSPIDKTWNFFTGEAKFEVQGAFDSLAANSSLSSNQIVGYRSSAHYESVKNLNRLLCGFPDGKKILDAGCGHGNLSGIWTEKNKVVGVDISPEMLVLARERGLEGHLAQIDELPFADQTFDIIICCGVVQYYLNPLQVIKEFSRVLKSGGVLIIDTLNTRSILRRLYRFFSRSTFPYLSCHRSIVSKAVVEDLSLDCIGWTYAPFGFCRVDSGEDINWLNQSLASNFVLRLIKS